MYYESSTVVCSTVVPIWCLRGVRSATVTLIDPGGRGRRRRRRGEGRKPGGEGGRVGDALLRVYMMNDAGERAFVLAYKAHTVRAYEQKKIPLGRRGARSLGRI